MAPIVPSSVEQVVKENVQHESKSFTPREYQLEILEAAKIKNTIACLGTGTGKTFIAVMLIRESANHVRRPFKDGGKRIFFLVPTVPLVLQQSKTIGEHTDLKVKGYYGLMDIDSWDKDQWTQEFTDNEVFVMTAEIFRIIVHHAFIPITQIQLLIIDECHRAQGNHPYREALKCFQPSQKSEEMPRIFGLSASLLNGKCNPTKLESKLKELEKTLHSTIVTASDIGDLKRYGTDPNEYMVLYASYQSHADDLLRDTMAWITAIEREKSAFLTKATSPDFDCQFFDHPLKSLKSLERILNTLGPWCAGKAAGVYRTEVQSLLRHSKTVEYTNLLTRINQFLEYFKQICDTLVSSSCDPKENAPDKLLRLLEVFTAAKKSAIFCSENPPMVTDVTFEEDPEGHHRSIRESLQENQLCSLIFVEQRVTAYVLCEWLTEVSKTCKDLEFLQPQFVVGHGVRGMGSRDMSMNEKLQQKKLKQFRKNECNVLIATQVLEEGMDIRQCNLVVRFDLPWDFRSYVQSKGRARSKDSSYIILVEEGPSYNNFVIDLCNFKTIEKVMVLECHNRSKPTEEEVLEHMGDDAVPPYMPRGPDGPRITITSAISLINRYCSSLPTDMATKLVPKFHIHLADEENIEEEYECVLQMPINSPLRQPIVSDVMRQKKLAKMSAALKACKLLDEIGELNENLVPISCLVDQALEEELGDEEMEDGKGAIPGTNRRRQPYEKKVPIYLQEAKPQPGILCYLHVIVMDLVFPLPPELNPRKRPILDPADTTLGLAILTTKELPPVNPFPIFTKHGKILITFETSSEPVRLSGGDVKNVEDFHRFIFTDALCVERGKHRFSPDSARSAYYIVPVNRGKVHRHEIDWDFMARTANHPYHAQMRKTSSTVKRTVYREADFSDAVLLRAYKMESWATEPRTFHHVVKIHPELSPRSDFLVDLKFKTFREYFYSKYKAVIQSDDQPMLETVQSGGLHMWKPMYTMAKEVFDDKAVLSKTKQKHRDYREYLVPELSIVHPFPSSFFTKVMCLPTVLFRLHSLLLAEEIRRAVAREASIGVELPKNGAFEWGVFHLETSDQDLRDHLRSRGILQTKDVGNVLVPRDVVKNGDEIESFEARVDLRDHPGPEPKVLLQALTPRSTGDEFDLERLETIGDSFLKYVMTLKIFVKYQNFDEGKLTQLRIGLIKNYNLYKRAKSKNLPQYMTTANFHCASTWLPPCYAIEEVIDEKSLIKKSKKRKLDEEGAEENPLYLYFTKQVISDKCVADAVEALIGAYLLTCGQKGALRFMSWLGLNPLVEKEPSEEQFNSWPPPSPNPFVVEDTVRARARVMQLTQGFDRFERSIGYQFRNKAYLLQAMTHPSYSDNDVTDCYQRLEFLGDAVLDYLITRRLYEDPCRHSPGKLTDLRSAMVNNIYFASLAIRFGYHKHLLIQCCGLFTQVDSYVKLLEETEAYKFFEEHLYFLEELECFELEEVQVPKALGDVFEAVAGAIYLDSGMSLDAVWKVCYPMIEPAMKHLSQHVPMSPVRELYERVRAVKIFGEPILRDGKTYVEVRLPDGRRFHGVGSSKKVAKKSAAKRALAVLKAEQLSPNSSPVRTSNL